MTLLDELEARRRPADCADDVSLSRLLAGELLPTRAAALRGHAAGCDRCAGRLAELEAARVDFGMAPPWRLPPAPVPPRRTAWWTLGFGLVGAACAAGLALALIARPSAEGEAPTHRSKGGGVRFDLVVERAGNVVAIGERDELRPGDRLQVLYTAATPTHLAVLSRDGAGVASVYFPTEGSMTWPAPAGRDVVLPASTELDGTLGPEAISLIACVRPTALADLRAATAPDGVAPAGCAVEVVHLVKRADP